MLQTIAGVLERFRIVLLQRRRAVSVCRRLLLKAFAVDELASLCDEGATRLVADLSLRAAGGGEPPLGLGDPAFEGPRQTVDRGLTLAPFAQR